MLRIVLVSICLFSLSKAASAQSPYFRTSYELTSFNDGWGGGFSEIHDDGRSMGMRFVAQSEMANAMWLFDASFSGITRQRYAKQSRVDELSLSVGVPLYSIDERLQVHGLIGLYSFGNRGLSAIQNSVHDAVGTRPVELEYEDANLNSPLFGLQVRGTIPLGDYSSNISSGLQGSVNYHYVPGYIQSFRAEASYYIQSKWADRVLISTGYNYQSESEYLTQVYTSRLERGFFYGVSTQIGGVLYKFEVYPNMSFSTGSLGFALEPNQLSGEFSKQSFTFELGMVSHQNGLYQRFLIPAFGSKYFSFDIHHQFWSMTWKRLDGFPQAHGHDRQFSGGFQVTPFAIKNKFQILPYVSLRTGWRTEHRYSGMEAQTPEMYSALVGIAEGGVRLKLPAKILSRNCSYGLTGFYTTRMEFHEFSDIGSLTRHTVEGYGAAYGVALFVATDL
ncbi:hypothetical protein [Phaeocystidibacter luteus]|nr:hypothetical protein [Phaeocystidibacter luteus]